MLNTFLRSFCCYLHICMYAFLLPYECLTFHINIMSCWDTSLPLYILPPILFLFYYNLVSKSQVVVSTSLCPRCTTTLHCLLPQKPALNHISPLLSKLVARIRFSLEKQLKFEFIPSIHKPLEANVKGPMLLTRP